MRYTITRNGKFTGVYVKAHGREDALAKLAGYLGQTAHSVQPERIQDVRGNVYRAEPTR